MPSFITVYYSALLSIQFVSVVLKIGVLWQTVFPLRCAYPILLLILP